MKTPMVGLDSYTALLLASARCGFSSHHGPVLAVRIESESRSLRLMSALRRTPPTTTISATCAPEGRWGGGGRQEVKG